MPTRQARSPLAIFLAGIFLIVLLTGLAVRFWASEREYEFAGPTHIAAGQGGVFVFASGFIHHLSPQGELLSVFGAERTLLADDPIDLRVLENGELLIAEQRPAKIRLCDPSTWACREPGLPETPKIRRQFKVLPLDDAGTWLITDARRDAIWRFDPSSGALVEALPGKTLSGPNGLAFDAHGHPWVADTDNRRIVELLPQGDGTFTTGREHSARNDLTRGRRHFPMMIERGPDGRLWVAQAARFTVTRADLVVYDPEEGAVAVAALPRGAYATDLAVSGGEVLMTDVERFTVNTVDGATLEVGEFGNQAFHSRLQHYREARVRYAQVGITAMIATVLSALLLILAVIRITPRDQRWSQAPPVIDFESVPETAPPTGGIHWLELNSKTQWMAKWFEKVFYVLFGLLILVSVMIYAWSEKQPWPAGEDGLTLSDRLNVLLVAANLAVASFIPLIHFAAGAFRRRIGTDGLRVHMELENGRRMAVRPHQLSWNDRALLYRQYTFPLQTGRKKAIYADGEVQAWLAPLLREAPRIGEWQIFRHQLRHRDALIMAMAGAAALMALILVLAQLALNAQAASVLT